MPFRGLSLTGGAAYNRAIYDLFKNGGGVGVNFDGNTMIEAPRWTASGTAAYAFDVNDKVRASASFTYTYKSSTFSDPSNQARYHQDAQHLLNGEIGLGFADDALHVAIFGRNLANVTFREAAFATGLGYSYVTLNQPRTLGVELRLKR